MKKHTSYLLDSGETFDEETSLCETYNAQKNDKIHDELDFLLSFAEEIQQVYDLHNLYSSSGEYFPIIELGDLVEMDEKCTTS